MEEPLRPIAGGGTPAAQYVRMSTEHQQYSTQNQADAIRRYADAHGMEIIKTYSDEGKSGLNLEGRGGLRELLHDVESGNASYRAVLVYDVSRWGRFQDADESAYYEYICKRANVRIHYCAEQFENDGSLPSSLMKTMKRTMAGEYSRELSAKVFAGQCRLIELGFRQGGVAGYGLRRQLVDQNGRRKELLDPNQHKSIQTDRVILVPGPETEIKVVQEIYRSFTREGRDEREIADLLNSRGLKTDFGRPWTRSTVRAILTNPKYVGSNVYNKRSFKLKRKRVKNPAEMWIVRENAFAPIVSLEEFGEAKRIVESRITHLTDEECLQRLKNLLDRHGTLSGFLIDESDDLLCSSTYRSRFGSLARAYTLIGFTPARDFSYIERNRALRQNYSRQILNIISDLRASGAQVDRDPKTDLLTINREFTASLVLARCRVTRSTHDHRWIVRLDTSLSPDVTIAARLCVNNEDILDYYLLPRLDELANRIRLANDNSIVLEVYRFDNLDFFFSMGRRVALTDAA